jgi:hypothetical protein
MNDLDAQRPAPQPQPERKVAETKLSGLEWLVRKAKRERGKG